MQQILYEVHNRIGFITLNRPEKRNALNSQMVEALKASIKGAIKDESCKVIILKANGKAFCAGADLEYLQQLQKNTFGENVADSQSLKDLFLMIHQSPKVIIAQIQGHALAGGCGLAAVCDFSFSVPDAKFSYTEVKIGFIPALVMVFLVRKIGEGKSRELLLSGDILEAADAAHLGLISKVIDTDKIEAHCLDFATQLVEKSSAQSMAKVKEMMIEIQNLTLADGLDYAAKQNAIARESADCKKGITNFLNKTEFTW
jgi:methylglutaconyl-CoA hydratase